MPFTPDALPPPPRTNWVLALFVHSHLNSVQQGLQAAHLLGQWWRELPPASAERAVLDEWIQGHGAIQVYRGGDMAKLDRRRVALELLAQDWTNSVDTPSADDDGLAGQTLLGLPHLVWGAVRERISVLNGAITAVGVLVPDEIPLISALLAPDEDAALSACLGRRLPVVNRLGLFLRHASPLDV